MYPRPVPETAHASRRLYMTLVGAILIIWLAPLFAVILTSFRSMADVMSGNLWGWPTEIAVVENYTAVFTQTPMARYFLNSLVITIPSVVGVLVLSTLAGFVLARYRFPGNMLIFALFVGGNFLPHQIMMIPVRDLMVRLNLYDTTTALIVFHVASRPVSRRSSCATSSPRCPTNCSRPRVPRVRTLSDPDPRRRAPRPAGIGGARHPALHLHLERLFLGGGFDSRRQCQAGDGRACKPTWRMGLRLEPDLGRHDHRRRAAGRVFFLMQKHFIAGLTMGAVKG